MRKDVTELRERYQSMEDHDLLIDIAVTQKFIESRLKELNGSVKGNKEEIFINSGEIASIKAICEERSRNYPLLFSAEDKRTKRFLIIMIILASASGVIGANVDKIIQLVGLG